jgi:bacillopeptidase F (M6 metalloprotease family)
VFPSFSIGNSGPNPNTTGSPGNVPSAFGVGATDMNDVIASFSSRGPVTWNYPPYVGTWVKPDISAPGVSIFSSVPGGSWEYSGWSGTSMAAPHMSGTVALMLQANPTLTVDMLKQLVSDTALDLGAAGMDNDYGWGRVNAFAAVSAALSGVGTLNGTVYSSMGGTLDNVLVHVLDTGQKVKTNASGVYTMMLVAGDHTVEFSKFGYESTTLMVTVVADMTTTQDATLNQLPSGTVAGFVTDADTGDGVSANITVRLSGSDVASAVTDPMTGAYSVLLPIGTYDFIFNPAFPYPTTARTNVEVYNGMTTTLDVALNAAQVLIVDDDAGKAYQAYFEAAVQAAGRSYLTVTTPPTAAQMASFESVVWLTGDDYTSTLTAADQAELAAFLDAGGRLFISGQDIGYHIRTSAFYGNYLKAAYVQDDTNLGAVIGSAASPVGQGFVFNIKGGDGANNQAYPSEIDPIGGAQTAFVYDPAVPSAASTMYKMSGGEPGSDAIVSSGTSGLTYDGAYKLVYFAFGFEAIASATDRGAVMTRILDWLQGYPEIAHTPLGDTEDTQNPYAVKAFITSDYFGLDTSTFGVIYDTGGPSNTVAMYATGVPDEYVGYIPAQPNDTQVNYYITASDVMGHTTTDPLGAPANKHSFWVAADTEDPVVVHHPHRNTNDLEGPYAICATVTDNIGVESVHLMYAKNGGLFHRVTLTSMGDDEYCGAIPGPSEVGDYYEYYIYAMDESYSGNVTRMPATGTYRFDIVEEFVWDFELDDGGFVVTGDVWEWGSPTAGPGGAHSGVNVWATKLAADYPNSANAKLDIPPITLAASKPYALLSFWHWYYIETNWDGGNVKVSADEGATWTVVEPFGGYDGTANTANAGIPGQRCFTGYNNAFWQEELFDLSAFAGQTVMIRFHFGSDPSVPKTGWYIDDVVLRSTDVDDMPPVITGVTVPASTFDTVGPYAVSCYVTDPLSGVGSVSVLYSTDNGMTFSEIAMGPGANPNQWTASIPGQTNGTRVKFYVRATDTASTPNVTTSPAGAPADTYMFAILPSAPILVIQHTSTASTLAMFREALEAYGHAADYWNRATQGWLDASKLGLYKTIILDATSGLTTQEQTDLAAFLNSGTLGAKKHFFILGRDLGFSSATRGWIEQYMRAAYVQDNPLWYQITGEPGEPIGAGETFVISGSYPDEIQRSAAYPGGEIVYRYTGTGTAAAETRSELQGAYDKDEKEWDGVMPHAPISLDAAAGIKYAGDKYRSLYTAFNFYYVQEPARRAGIMDRALKWLSAPDIMHTPLPDTEDDASPYIAVAKVYSETLDPARVRLTYDVGMGPVIVTMTPTGNPNEFSAAIPAQSYGTTVNYYLSAANFDGTTSYHPHGAPAVQHSFVVNADMVPPVIVHVPYANTTSFSGPYTITAAITDNIGVDASGVFLTYNKNGGANTTIPMMNTVDDTYAADIPGPAVLGDVFNYYIRARDIAAVPNEAREPAAGAHSFQIVDYYAWDFEASNGGFTATGPDWEWGDPTSGPMDAHSGVNVWATKLAGNYSASSNSKLDLPPVVVPGSQTYAILSFWQWYATETGPYDGMNVKLSTDGGATWTILTPDIGYNAVANPGNAAIPGEPCFSHASAGKVWHEVAFNLTAYKGQTVWLRLHFGSDSSVQYAGFYVDDLLLAGVNDTFGPKFISTTVPTGTWDTVGPYTVKTKVIDFLSGVSSVTLYYSTDNGATWSGLPMLPTGVADEYSAGVPGQPLGTKVKLYVEASDNLANTSRDPANAPTTTFEFGVGPSSQYLVVLGGGSNTPAQTFVDAFTAIGKTCDVWNWDSQGLPSLAQMQAYTAVIVDESWYFDTAQLARLTEFLDANRLPVLNKVFFMGRDMSYGSGAPRTFMEKYTGTAYVKDDPGFRKLRGMAGDPIGGGLAFNITGSYPDEVKLSTLYPGAQIVFKYWQLSSAGDGFSTVIDAQQFFEKEGKEWDPRLWPFAPSGPDSVAGARYVGTKHAAVYFAFQFNYITDVGVRATILDRALNWLGSATVMGHNVALEQAAPLAPDKLVLGPNYPNPFNPVTRIQVGIPTGYTGQVELRVYNVQGQLVKTVFEGTKPAGFYTFEWDGTSNHGTTVSSGIYFARFQAGQTVLTRKMVLLK